jgi:two-component system sensor histidine kinase CssS
MKRLNLWLRELSLNQQLLAIIILFISVFAIFISTFLSPALDQFSQNEMYRLLHNSQESLLSYLDNYDGDLDEIVPNEDAEIVDAVCQNGTISVLGTRSLPSDLQKDIVSHTEQDVSGTQDYKCTSEVDDRVITYLYSMTLMKNGSWLISVMDNAYQTQFKTSLVNEVVTMNVLVVLVLFIILMAWVSTLIVPLSQIRTYIEKVKNDEPAQLNVHRRDAIGQVADALRDMEGELQKQNQQKQEMIQNISHDLKTPIATIKSYGESIKDGIYPYDTLEKSVDVIIEHADRLEKKVQSLIVLNKMDYLQDETPDGDTVDMNEVIDQVILSLKVIRPEISLEKDTEENVFFHGAQDPWRIVVENLVDNGLRYAVSHIRIVLKENELSVINDGSPIPDEDLERIFRPYEKGTNGRFGLGLSIVYKVVTTYGYHVDAENLPGGVCFRVWREGRKPSRRKKKETHNSGGQEEKP